MPSKLAISNIAWDYTEQTEVLAVLQKHEIQGIEISPTKCWQSPTTVSEEAVKDFRKIWNDHGINIVAVQSLLYGKPELQIFASDEAREKTLEHLRKIARIAALAGAKALVFGSPPNRKVPNEKKQNAMDIAVDFFSRLGQIGSEAGVCFCIEPNAPQYNCNFVISAKEGIELVKTVNHPGFRLHLDSACMYLNEDDLEESIELGIDWLAHFHISEPFLAPVQKSLIDHKLIAATLKRVGYNGWISIEMRDGATQPNTIALETALAYIKSIYD